MSRRFDPMPPRCSWVIGESKRIRVSLEECGLFNGSNSGFSAGGQVNALLLFLGYCQRDPSFSSLSSARCYPRLLLVATVICLDCDEGVHGAPYSNGREWYSTTENQTADERIHVTLIADPLFASFTLPGLAFADAFRALSLSLPSARGTQEVGALASQKGEHTTQHAACQRE